MNIIEKLGITLGEWENLEVTTHIHKICVLGSEGYEELAMMRGDNIIENSNVIASAPEMLEALIDIYRYINDENFLTSDSISDIALSAIQKATGKSWEKIRELINEK